MARLRSFNHLTKKVALPGLVAFVLACLFAGQAVYAQSTTQIQTASDLHAPAKSPVLTAPLQQNGPHPDCMTCHGLPGLTGEFTNGDQISLTVDSKTHVSAVHGSPLNCGACHTEQRDYPHDTANSNCEVCHPGQVGESVDATTPKTFPIKTPSKRAFVLSMNEACRRCHAEQFATVSDSVHARLAKQGNEFAPTCVDCHRDFSAMGNSSKREAVGEICKQCHLSVYTSYASSVHGQVLGTSQNPDVPTCGDCHGIHSVHGPSDTQFHNDIPTMCGKCHADINMMVKYNISTDVFQTYEADFHGKAVESFRQQDSNLPSNRAVCTDCHGTHNIRRTDDPQSTVMQENLLATCRRCHTEASFRFPAAWAGHKTVTSENQPELYRVNQLYQTLIVITAVGCLAVVGLDAQRHWRDSRREKKNGG